MPTAPAASRSAQVEPRPETLIRNGSIAEAVDRRYRNVVREKNPYPSPTMSAAIGGGFAFPPPPIAALMVGLATLILTP